MEPLVSAAGIKARLLQYGLCANKALGQNFLADADALSRMLSLLPFENGDVLEIGPGLGGLTEGLCARARRVTAVEKDGAMVRVLKETLPCENLTLLNGDILFVDLHAIHAQLGGGPIFIAGNLPYYITTPIATRFLTSGLPIGGMVFMVQQEAARRFLAGPGEKVYGPLSVLTALLYKAEEAFRLSPQSYFPAPAVSSSVVRFIPRDGGGVPAGFYDFLRQAFAMRRKTLQNNLTAAGYEKERVLTALSALPPAIRAEALQPEALLDLYNYF